MTQNERGITICKNYEILSQEVARNILLLSERAITAQGRFTIALSGGITSSGVYRAMSSPDYRDQFQWSKIHFFWGDERWVAPDHPRSNYHAAVDSLLSRIDIPFENIHPIRTKEASAEIAASLYTKELHDFFKTQPDDFPQFDLMLLGLGQDGHTASLFPGSAALQEKKRWVMTVSHHDVSEVRITMTLPVINHSEHIYFVVSGVEKSRSLQTIFELSTPDNSLPAQRVHTQRGAPHWFVDEAAAFHLRKIAG